MGRHAPSVIPSKRAQSARPPLGDLTNTTAADCHGADDSIECIKDKHPTTECDSAETVAGLRAVLRAAKLENHVTAADEWCERLGAVDLSELEDQDIFDSLVADMRLKPLEARRLRKALLGTSATPEDHQEFPNHLDTSREGFVEPERRGLMSPMASTPSALDRSGVSGCSPSMRANSNENSFVASCSFFSSSPGSPMSGSPCLDRTLSVGSHYVLEEEIGVGAFGVVNRVRDLRTDQCHAMKRNKKQSMAIREIATMQAVNDPNVMQCFEVVNGGNIVMDIMDSDLKKVLGDERIFLKELHVRNIAAQIMSGMAAIHQAGYVHRDFSPANVLLDSSTNSVKLCDFGIARTFGCQGGAKMTPLCTTLAYRAPEGLHGSRMYTPAVDVWSVGCIVAEMFLRKELFPGTSAFDMLERVLHGLGNPSSRTFERLWGARAKKKTWEEVCASPWMSYRSERPGAIAELVPPASPVAQQLLRRLLQLDPRLRPSAEEALDDEFFRE